MFDRYSAHIRIGVFFVILVGFCLAPVWMVEHFVNQDGSAHVYSSFAMLGILRGEAEFGAFFSMNSIAVPNSSGHWLMAGLAVFFSPWIVTKLIVSLTFALFVAGAGWLRYRTVGSDGVATSLMFGAAVAFNWLWLVGFYNFLLGACCFLFTVGLVAGWRDRFTIPRALLLSLLFLLAYTSHIISFAVLAGSVILLTFAMKPGFLKQNMATVAIALAPALPLMLIFRSVSAAGGGGGLSPVWRNLVSVWSPSSWIAQLRSADPFILLSRKAFPFADESLAVFALFAPILWIAATLAVLAIATFLARRQEGFLTRTNLIFAILLFGSLGVALLAPDDFGLSNGSVLRERLMICGIMFAIPLFRTGDGRAFKALAMLTLSVVVCFQTAALWEYSLQTDRAAREVVAMQRWIGPGERVATLTIEDAPRRFSSVTVPMMSNYFGASGTGLILDNYELGHYLFPVIAKTAEEKAFILEFTQNSVLRPFEADAFETRKQRIAGIFERRKINKLIVAGNHPEIEELILRYFVLLERQGTIAVYRPIN